ncbi:Op4 protein [Candida orthopsilosis Co 90-125]|uniref:Op4 protein n=1 Tax=Candida orthopsilosis (strain 90-125) TaxID=1136231 RepID=H8WVV7_CANO9|nr:Op4 protein [Candida orthopsilosis Co 90-125]CCG20581.1 Op4 protein [Candida orthopsilosis Co 90-125]
MKFSQTTLLAVLASSAFVSAAPAIVAEQSMVKREDVNDVLAILKEIKEHNAKREYLEGDALIEHDKRADSALGNLISALSNSGIISQVWNTLTTNDAIKTSLSNIVQSAIQTAVVQGPALISAIWNSGLLGDIFNDFLNDTDLRSAFLDVAKSIFGTAVNLITSWLSGSSSSSTTTAAASTSTGTAAKRELLDLNAEYIDKRDLSSIIQFIVQEISDSGIVSSLVNKALADPQASISFLTSAFQNGLVIVQDVYDWAKQSGLWDSALSYISANAGTWASAIASFLGNALTSGTVSASEIDNASSSVSARSTTPVSTAAAANSAIAATTAAPAATSTTAAAATGTTGTTATTAASGNNDALNSLIDKYGGSSATTAAASVDTSGLSGSVNQLVSAAGQAASSLKRRNY